MTPTPAQPGPGWIRPALVVLGVLLAVSVGLDRFLDDNRFLPLVGFLWPVVGALLILTVPSPRAVPGAGPSPWTPTLLRVLAVITGAAGGILLFVAGQSGSTQDDPAAAVLAVVLIVLVVSALVLLLVVSLRAGARALPWHTPLLPGLSAADRRRARNSAAAPVVLYCAAVLLSPWLPSSLLIWVPVALAFALGLPLWAWWVTRLASSQD